MKYSLIKLLLNEYTDKTINQMAALYKPQTNDSEDQIKRNIVRYGELIPSVETKLRQNNPIVINVIPDDLKQNNRFKDITLVKDYNTLARILKAVEKKETDIYKAAIEYFKKKDRYMDPSIIGMYVGQFKRIKTQLEKAVADKNENVINLIPDELIRTNKYNNILSYKNFNDLEKLIDGAFPFESKKGEEINSVDIDADKIYENPNDGIEIYKGDDQHKCVKYGKNQTYGWCISRVKGSLYGNYRFMQGQDKNRMFYFVKDNTQTDAKNNVGGGFVNPYHIVVIHALENGKYTRTTANNTGDDPYEGAEWNGLGQYFKGEDGQRMWNKIKGLKKYFPYIPPSAEERRAQGLKGQRLTLNSFIDLDQEDKQAWLRINADDRNIVTPEIAKSLDNEQINDLINHDRKFSFDELKKSQGLLKRYADYRFTRHPKDPIPYIFIPYLKPELQEKYFDEFADDYITFPVLEKYFNENIIKKYVDRELEQFGANLPPEAKKYMSKEQQDIYDLYSLVFKDMTNEESKVDENSITAPEQYIVLPSISQKSYNELSPEDRKKLNNLYKELGSNKNNISKYSNFFMGYPTAFEAGGKPFLITPSDTTTEKFVIIDEDGNTIIDNINYITFFKNENEIDYDVNIAKQVGNNSSFITSTDYDQIKITDSNNKTTTLTQNDINKRLTESITNNYLLRQFKYKAGIIK
jgi:hypothetical protein